MKGNKKMIENLSLREKIGQMLIVGLDSNIINERIKNLILNYKISGVILYRKNFNTYEDMVKLISELIFYQVFYHIVVLITNPLY